jgi:hypothetical protein
MHFSFSRVCAGCVIYGGDQYKPDKPDIGAIARALKQLGVRVIAMQSDKYLKCVCCPHSSLLAP